MAGMWRLAVAGMAVAGIGMLAGCGDRQPAAETTVATVPPPAVAGPGAPVPAVEAEWRDGFTVDTRSLRPGGANPYFPLQVGRKLTYAGEENGEQVELVITVTNKTELVDGVLTRVVEERESKDGELVEVSRNFFAIDPATNDLYYFGEDVDMYRDGRITSHEGAWRSGMAGVRFGLLLPGTPRLGDRYYQEVAPGIALDRAEIISLTDTLATPSGTYSGCLRTEETSGLNAGERGAKVYAPGIGLIRDSVLLLKSVAP